MKPGAALSLTAWLWKVHPDIIDALLVQMRPQQLGQCIGCDLSLFTGCSGFTSVADPSICLDSSVLDPANLTGPSLTCSGASLNSLGIDTGVCIPTLSESDLTPVPTCAVTGGCLPALCSGAATSINNTDAQTSSALSGVANFLTSGAGLLALAKVASSYFQAQAASSQASAAASATQAAILNAQAARAAVGKAALPITYVTNGSTGASVPVISTVAGSVPLTGSMLASFTPNSIEVFLAQYGTWLLVGGAAAFLAYAATRKRAT